MARGGHNAKPASEHKKTGTYQKSRHENRAENAVKPVESVPDAPEYFDERHRKEWAKCCKFVFELGILIEPDTYLIESFVVNWFIWKDAAAEVRRVGITIQTEKGVIKNPAVNVMNEAARNVTQIAALFGFSPRARMSIKTEPKPPEDKLGNFLN